MASQATASVGSRRNSKSKVPNKGNNNNPLLGAGGGGGGGGKGLLAGKLGSPMLSRFVSAAVKVSRTSRQG